MIRKTTKTQIGSRIPKGTSGSVLFIDSNGKLAQDNSSLFWDDTNNRLGIGTAIPDVILNVYENSNSISGSIFLQQAGVGDSSIRLSLVGATNWQFGIDNSDSDKFKIESASGLSSNAELQIEPGLTNAIYIDSNSKVGFGTTTPATKLNINTASLTTGLNEILRIGGSTNYAATEQGLTFYNNNQNYITGGIYSSAGSSYTTPIFHIKVADSSKALYNRLSIDKDGNVGIGTTTPNEKLHVVGKIRANTAFNINGTDGASGSFTSADGKTITVSGGIITSIV